MAGAALNSAGRAFIRTVAGVCALWAHMALAPANGVEIYSESAVKAAFVLRFAGYVEWPDNAIADGQFRIAVLGDPALADHLENLAGGRVLAGRSVHVSRVSATSQARDAQVLVIGPARRGELRTLLRPLSGSAVLVVTSEEGALAAGSVINFLKDQDRLRFEVSLPASRRMGLRVSSELLSVAVRVDQ